MEIRDGVVLDSVEAWAAIEPHLPTKQPNASRVDDRRVISGILRVLKVGFRWCENPADYGPLPTIYNRFNRESRRRVWLTLEALNDAGAVTCGTAIDSTYIKEQRSALGQKKGRRDQANHRSRRGFTTEANALIVVFGRPSR